MSEWRIGSLQLVFLLGFLLAPVTLSGCAEEESAANLAPDPGATAAEVDLDEGNATQ
ncbi:hypothetical protein [Maioricimonas sp. JC845]|uniref:hypothetical protein n=1 Tax=Maioricimonas sp. JC845 TaxID=3232138 RepID=UPI003458497F